MPWNETLNDLQRVLADLYPAEADARRVSEQAGLTAARIDFSNAAINVWHDVLGQALREERVQALIDIAHQEYPTNSALARAIERYVPAEKAPGEHVVVGQGRPKRRHIFISHATEDGAIARRLAADLRRMGLAVWIAPESIRAGEGWVPAIERGLGESDTMVLLLTPAAARSRWVNKEMEVAIGLERQGRMDIFPLCVRACQTPLLWSSYQWIPFGDYATGLERLVETLGLSPIPGAVTTRAAPPTEKTAGEGPDSAPQRPPLPAGAPRKLSRRQVLLLAGGGAAIVGGTVGGVLLSRCTAPVTPTPTPTATATIAPTETATPEPTDTATSPQPTDTPRPTDSPTAELTETTAPETAQPTNTPEPTATSAPPPTSMVLTLAEGVQIELLRIPAGPFLMGSDPAKDPQADDDEKPQHTLTLPDYDLAKTPVTNAQYEAFVRSTGHGAPNSWAEGKPPQGKENHPVANVDWNDALAFCRWASDVSGYDVQLPSEAQWEKGARGSDGRIYPWGDDWDAARCNTSESGAGGTTPVDRYPQGASPYGLLDMAGNVWEWTRSVYMAYPYRPEEREREDLAAGPERPRVLRGGSCYIGARGARCSVRFGNLPNIHGVSLGFRVVVAPSV